MIIIGLQSNQYMHDFIGKNLIQEKWTSSRTNWEKVLFIVFKVAQQDKLEVKRVNKLKVGDSIFSGAAVSVMLMESYWPRAWAWNVVPTQPYTNDIVLYWNIKRKWLEGKSLSLSLSPKNAIFLGNEKCTLHSYTNRYIYNGDNSCRWLVFVWCENLGILLHNSILTQRK